MSEVLLTVERTKWIETGALYRVLHDGEVVVKNSRNPEHDACRWALKNTQAETAAFLKPDGSRYMTMNIEGAAKYTLTETETRTLRRIKWRPYGQGTKEGTSTDVEPA